MMTEWASGAIKDMLALVMLLVIILPMLYWFLYIGMRTPDEIAEAEKRKQDRKLKKMVS